MYTAQKTKNTRLVAGWLRLVRESTSTYEREIIRSASMSSSADVARLLAPRINQEIVEVMYLVALDGRNHVIGLSEVARGGLHGCGVTARDILRMAIASGASAFVLVHNHPSGDPTPSVEDLEMTRVLDKASAVVGCQMLDHIVIAGDRHASMLDLGIISG